MCECELFSLLSNFRGRVCLCRTAAFEIMRLRCLLERLGVEDDDSGEAGMQIHGNSAERIRQHEPRRFSARISTCSKNKSPPSSRRGSYLQEREGPPVNRLTAILPAASFQRCCLQRRARSTSRREDHCPRHSAKVALPMAYHDTLL